MDLVEALATFVRTGGVGDLPARDGAILTLHATDAALARVAGGLSAEGAHVRQVFGTAGADGIAAVAAQIRLSEMDDIHTLATATPSSVAASVAFGLYAMTPCPPEQVRDAIYVGIELTVRFAAAMDGARALFKGYWPTRTAGTLGACATAARLLGLSQDQTVEALKLAFANLPGRNARYVREPSGRWIAFGNAVGTGVRMSRAAQAGFKGGEETVDGAWLSSALGLEIDATKLTQDLGVVSTLPELGLKPYATARQSLAAAEAMRALVAEGLDVDTIERITVRVPTAHRAMVAQPLDPNVRVSAFVSAAGQVATAALLPDDLYDIERRRVFADPRLMALAARVTVEGDAALDAAFPRVWPTEIVVETTHGRVTRRVADVPGSPEAPFAMQDVLAKGQRTLAWFGQAHRADEIVAVAQDMFASPGKAQTMARIFSNG